MTGVIGIIPAAGLGSRVPNLPCSKEVFPIGFRAGADGEQYPKPVGAYVIDQMVQAGVERVFIVIRKGKWDIPQCLGDGSDFGAHFSYLIQERMVGLPGALDLVYPWVHDEITLFGMPDTIISPTDALRQVVDAHSTHGADVTLGLFPTDAPEKFGMVDFDDRGRFVATVDKPKQCSLRYMWGLACWGPAFTAYLHSYMLRSASCGREIVLSEVLQSAHDQGMFLRVVPFANGHYLDVGTPSDLAGAVRLMSSQTPSP